jgi:hypothetical protein
VSTPYSLLCLSGLQLLKCIDKVKSIIHQTQQVLDFLISDSGKTKDVFQSSIRAVPVEDVADTLAISNVKQEDPTTAESGVSRMDLDDANIVYLLLQARGLEDADAWKGVGDLMVQIRNIKQEDKLSVISAYSPPVSNGPGFVLGVLLEQEPMAVVAIHIESFTESLGPDIPHNKEEIVELFSRHRQAKDQVAPIHPIVEDERFPIPSQAQQQLRCCALNMDLVDWCLVKFNDRQYDQSMIRKWFIDKPERLEGTGLTIEDFSVDHVVPLSLGGISYVYNYALIPKRVNSKCRERFDNFKRVYLGRQSIGIALGFARWACVRTDVHFSQFNVANWIVNESGIPKELKPKSGNTLNVMWS